MRWMIENIDLHRIFFCWYAYEKMKKQIRLRLVFVVPLNFFIQVQGK